MGWERKMNRLGSTLMKVAADRDNWRQRDVKTFNLNTDLNKVRGKGTLNMPRAVTSGQGLGISHSYYSENAPPHPPATFIHYVGSKRKMKPEHIQFLAVLFPTY